SCKEERSESGVALRLHRGEPRWGLLRMVEHPRAAARPSGTCRRRASLLCHCSLLSRGQTFWPPRISDSFAGSSCVGVSRPVGTQAKSGCSLTLSMSPTFIQVPSVPGFRLYTYVREM